MSAIIRDDILPGSNNRMVTRAAHAFEYLLTLGTVGDNLSDFLILSRSETEEEAIRRHDDALVWITDLTFEELDEIAKESLGDQSLSHAMRTKRALITSYRRFLLQKEDRERAAREQARAHLQTLPTFGMF